MLDICFCMCAYSIPSRAHTAYMYVFDTTYTFLRACISSCADQLFLGNGTESGREMMKDDARISVC